MAVVEKDLEVETKNREASEEQLVNALNDYTRGARTRPRRTRVPGANHPNLPARAPLRCCSSQAHALTTASTRTTA